MSTSKTRAWGARRWLRIAPAACAVAALAIAPGPARAGERHPLETWRLESSARAGHAGEEMSQPGYDDASWQNVRVPNTVLGALVENGTYPDPYTGTNLRSIPGTSYPIGERFTLLEMPGDSPFAVPWWYRTEFEVPASTAVRSTRLHFEGINYRAEIWLNGTRVAGSDEVAGAFRRYAFDVSGLLRPGAPNALAVAVTAPEPHDLAFMWVDWNPTPADKNAGLWGDVYLDDSGPLALEHPLVTSDLELPSLASARLAVSVEVRNTAARRIDGVVKGAIGEVRFSRAVSLAAGERRSVRFGPEDTSGLLVRSPRVWWPYRMGEQPLYTAVLEAEAEDAASDRLEVRFGIQQASSELTPEGHRLFRVNGRPILIRGGGWASDMLLRAKSRERLEAELRYVREMGLNTIRLEGKLEGDPFYELADRLGILVMPGWCCCDQWERWDEWDAEDHRVGPASLRDQALRLRNHPSVLAWLNGSDYPPPAPVEKAYLDVLAELEWPKPVLSNATDAAGSVSGRTGVKMRGPYDYVPPAYWLEDTTHGGAFGFATEISPGAAVPPIESLRRMLPPDHLWPIDAVWNYHAGGDEFKEMRLFNEALAARYGAPSGVEDYARKAQALAYEGERAMFEAYGRNKYRSTGVIQWMLNNAWPSMIWHLYDYYLRPGGGYYGTQRACEPLHVQYSYDDASVIVVNDLQRPFEKLRVSAEVFDIGSKPVSTHQATVDVPADAVVRALEIGAIEGVEGLEGAYLVRLQASDPAGAVLSRNLYWLSTRKDEIDWDAAEWYYTPTRVHSDLQALAELPPTALALETRFEEREGATAARVTVANRGDALAFQVHLRLVERGSGDEPLPVFWSDNYMSLLPGEEREVSVALSQALPPAALAVEASAWNAQEVVR